ncbi:36325_t:CDS:2, partial [Racocetra persica]
QSVEQSESVEQSANESVEQLENESYQSRSFEFDCLIKFDYERSLSAVSNNKIVAMRLGSHHLDLYNELLNEETLTKSLMQEAEFKTLIDEKIYYTSDRLLWVREIFKKQWIKYLREILKDNSKIRALPTKSQMVKILQEFRKKNISRISFEPCDGSFVKWKVNNNGKIQASLKNFDKNEWESIESIDLKYQFNYMDFHNIYRCDLLYNEDLVIITSVGLFIWSIWPSYKKIKLRYYINYRVDDTPAEETVGNSDKFDNLKNELKNILESLQKYETLLSAPDFDFIVINCNQSNAEERCFFKELLDDYIEDNILIKLYGQELLKCCLRTKNYSIAERLYYKIFNETEHDKFLEKIQLLDIITFSFIELTQFPQNLKEFLSYTLFIHSKEIKSIKGFSEPHLQSYIRYLQPPTTDASNNLNNSKELDTNMFTNLDTAYLAVYMMLTGDSSYVSNWSLTENPTLM